MGKIFQGLFQFVLTVFGWVMIWTIMGAFFGIIFLGISTIWALINGIMWTDPGTVEVKRGIQ